MGKHLKSYVHVQDEAGETHVYSPQDDVPPEHAKLIGDHAWVDDDEPLPDNRQGVVVENDGDAPQPRVEADGEEKPSSTRRGSRGK